MASREEKGELELVEFRKFRQVYLGFYGDDALKIFSDLDYR